MKNAVKGRVTNTTWRTPSDSDSRNWSNRRPAASRERVGKSTVPIAMANIP